MRCSRSDVKEPRPVILAFEATQPPNGGSLDEGGGVCPNHPHLTLNVELTTVVAPACERPLVKVFWVDRDGTSLKELAGYRRSITSFMELCLECQTMVELVPRLVFEHPVVVGILPSEDGGARRATQGSRGVRVREGDSLLLEE